MFDFVVLNVWWVLCWLLDLLIRCLSLVDCFVRFVCGDVCLVFIAWWCELVVLTFAVVLGGCFGVLFRFY